MVLLYITILGWCLPKKLSVNLSVYLHYGFLATTKPQKNVINKIGGISINQYCQTGMASMQ